MKRRSVIWFCMRAVTILNGDCGVAPVYHTVTAGSCFSNPNYEEVSSLTECAEAYESVHGESLTATNDDTVPSLHPMGCYYDSANRALKLAAVNFGFCSTTDMCLCRLSTTCQEYYDRDANSVSQTCNCIAENGCKTCDSSGYNCAECLDGFEMTDFGLCVRSITPAGLVVNYRLYGYHNSNDCSEESLQASYKLTCDGSTTTDFTAYPHSPKGVTCTKNGDVVTLYNIPLGNPADDSYPYRCGECIYGAEAAHSKIICEESEDHATKAINVWYNQPNCEGSPINVENSEQIFSSSQDAITNNCFMHCPEGDCSVNEGYNYRYVDCVDGSMKIEIYTRTSDSSSASLGVNDQECGDLRETRTVTSGDCVNFDGLGSTKSIFSCTSPAPDYDFEQIKSLYVSEQLYSTEDCTGLPSLYHRWNTMTGTCIPNADPHLKEIFGSTLTTCAEDGLSIEMKTWDGASGDCTGDYESEVIRPSSCSDSQVKIHLNCMSSSASSCTFTFATLLVIMTFLRN